MANAPRHFQLHRDTDAQRGSPSVLCCSYHEYGTSTALGSPFLVTTVGSSRKYAASMRCPSSARRSRIPMVVSSLMYSGYGDDIVYTVYMQESLFAPTPDRAQASVCIGEGCDRPAFSKGICHSHYERGRKYGDARLHIPIGAIARAMTPQCSIGGCSKPAHGRGWCGMHYKRWQDHGDPLHEPPSPCEGCAWPESCDRPHHAFGLCATHYQRRFNRRGYLKYTYKMTEAEWHHLFDAQGRLCPVCLRTEPPGDSVWHVHHDHRCCPGSRTCGKCVVAILCGPCNIGMGGLGDDPERLERAAQLMRGGIR